LVFRVGRGDFDLGYGHVPDSVVDEVTVSRLAELSAVPIAGGELPGPVFWIHSHQVSPLGVDSSEEQKENNHYELYSLC